MNKQLNLSICIYICLKPSFKLGQASSWIWGNGHTIDSSPQVIKSISLFISKQVNKLSFNIFSFYILHKSHLIVNLRSETIRNQLPHCVSQTVSTCFFFFSEVVLHNGKQLARALFASFIGSWLLNLQLASEAADTLETSWPSTDHLRAGCPLHARMA